MLKTHNIFRALAILLLGSIFLLVVFNNLPFPLNSYYFWVVLWFVALIFMKINVLLSKEVLVIYIFLVLYILMFNTVWNDYEPIYGEHLWNEFVAIFTAISIYTYFKSTGDHKGLTIVVCFTVIFVFVTAITSVIGLLQYPLASRELAGVLIRDGQYNIITIYEAMGIGGYGYFASVVCLLPLIVQLKKGITSKHSKTLIYSGLIILFSALILSQYFANIIIALIIIPFIWIFKPGKYNILLGILIVSSIFFLFPSSYFINIIIVLSNLFQGSLLEEKLLDLSIYVAGSTYGTEIDYRAARVPVLLESFINHPILGSGFGNGHLHWLNKLSLYGIAGSMPYLWVIYTQFKNNIKMFSFDNKYYYSLAILSFVLLGSIKSLQAKEVFYGILFIVPSICLIIDDQIYSPVNRRKKIG